jgi:hypothetical protein
VEDDGPGGDDFFAILLETWQANAHASGNLSPTHRFIEVECRLEVHPKLG